MSPSGCGSDPFIQQVLYLLLYGIFTAPYRAIHYMIWTSVSGLYKREGWYVSAECFQNKMCPHTFGQTEEILCSESFLEVRVEGDQGVGHGHVHSSLRDFPSQVGLDVPTQQTAGGAVGFVFNRNAEPTAWVIEAPHTVPPLFLIVHAHTYTHTYMLETTVPRHQVQQGAGVCFLTAGQ